MDDMIRMKNTKFVAFETKIDTLKQTLSKHVKEKESLLTTLNGFKMEFKERESKSINKEIVLENKNKELENIVSQRIKPTLYDGNVLSKIHDIILVVDDEETLNLAEESRLKMLNKLVEDFGKRFVPQQELSAEQKFWLQSSDKNSEEPSTSITPVKIVVPNELPKDLQAQLYAKDTIINKLKETTHSLRDNASPDKVKKDFDEIETINIELEHSVAKLLSENEKLHKKIVHLKQTYKELYDSIKLARVRAKEQKLKVKDVIDTTISKPNAITIASGMYKLELEHLPPKVLNNKVAHIAYINLFKDHADTLRDIVESARALSPLDSNLDSTCKYVQRIQEVLVYVNETCPCLSKPSKKLVAVTPKNKDKKVRFADPVTPSSNT
ncbi:hypothetical protein Tco_0567680 [Tanacetum coccineum]